MKYKGSEGHLSAGNRKEIIGYIEKCEHISTEEPEITLRKTAGLFINRSSHITICRKLPVKAGMRLGKIIRRGMRKE